ncbi:MAG: hypothetical protein IKW92_07560 [Firmicutes bacterium]|nr:hypothetical protein [Bacillota bacterium]
MRSGYPARFLRCAAGLLMSGTGYYLTVQATSIGIGAWETLQTGLSLRTGISYGNCTVMVSFAVILIDLLLKGKIGFGTVMNGVMVGKIVDFWHRYCNFLPATHSLPLGILYLLAGQIVVSVGMVVYMKAQLGCGPRDTLMVELGKRFPKANIGVVRFFIDIAALMAGALLGAPYGWGSVFAITCNSFILQGVFRIFKFESRSLRHEDIVDTVRNIRGRG